MTVKGILALNIKCLQDSETAFKSVKDSFLQPSVFLMQGCRKGGISARGAVAAPCGVWLRVLDHMKGNVPYALGLKAIGKMRKCNNHSYKILVLTANIFYSLYVKAFFLAFSIILQKRRVGLENV